jgi:hypothetical protein
MARRLLSYEEFASRAKEVAGSIPAAFLDGVEDVVVHRQAKRHPLLREVVTLGECEPSPLVSLTGGGPVRSIVHLYYGSFAELARKDPSFDLDDELRETVEHEVRHHLEDRAGVSALIDEDDLFDAHERFRAGLEVPRGWYRRGERLDEGVYAVGLDLFVELRLRRRELLRLRGTTLRLEVLGEPFEADLPADADDGETLTFSGEGLVAEGGEGEPGGEPGDEEAGDLHLLPIVRGR